MFQHFEIQSWQRSEVARPDEVGAAPSTTRVLALKSARLITAITNVLRHRRTISLRRWMHFHHQG
jgi:hypothetical protein